MTSIAANWWILMKKSTDSLRKISFLNFAFLCWARPLSHMSMWRQWWAQFLQWQPRATSRSCEDLTSNLELQVSRASAWKIWSTVRSPGFLDAVMKKRLFSSVEIRSAHVGAHALARDTCSSRFEVRSSQERDVAFDCHSSNCAHYRRHANMSDVGRAQHKNANLRKLIFLNESVDFFMSIRQFAAMLVITKKYKMTKKS